MNILKRVARKAKKILFPNAVMAQQLSPDFYRQVGYAQEGEDLIITRLMRKESGFFVDVGAHHPARLSNTYKLYLKGWRGINIDPLPGSMSLFNDLRPEDINLEVAITSETSKAKVRYFMFDEPAFNSLDEKNIADAEAAGNKLTGEVEVKCASFSSIIEDNKDKFSQIDLLTIDVEHHELNVLQSFPFDKFQPGIIVVEVKGLDLVNLEENSVYAYLIRKGYFLRSYLFHSAIFLRA